MKKFRIYHPARFDRELSKFDRKFQERVDKIEEHLIENPYYGTPLGYKWFRESRFENYRVYYLIYENFEAIFMVGISDKKDQQKVINTIKLLFEFFKNEIDKLLDDDENFAI